MTNDDIMRNKAYQPRMRRAMDAVDALRYVSGKTILTPDDVRALEAAQKKRDAKAARKARYRSQSALVLKP